MISNVKTIQEYLHSFDSKVCILSALSCYFTICFIFELMIDDGDQWLSYYVIPILSGIDSSQPISSDIRSKTRLAAWISS